MKNAPITSLAGLADDFMLTIADCATIMRRDYTTVYELVARGKIHSHRMGRRTIRVPVSDLRAYIASTRSPRQSVPDSFIDLKKRVS